MARINPVTVADKAEWLPLWQAYLDFYNNPLPDDLTDLTFDRFLDPAEPMGLFVARDGDRLVGFAAYLFHRSTWAREGYCYLEDLYVDEAARGQGVARALIEAVANAAKAKGATRLYWVTHDHNSRARSLYDKVADFPGLVNYQRAL